jgi:ABC-type Na+ efflux pump permease subunit
MTITGLGPLFWFEIIRAGRRAMYFWFRVVFVLVLALAVFFIHQATFSPSTTVGTAGIKASAEFSSLLFIVYGACQLGAVYFFTPSLAAPAITTEKERKTLDDLLTTRLRSSEIILGKWAARFVVGLTPLAAGLGLVGVLQVLGGVDPQSLGMLLRLAVLLIASMSAVSIFASTLAKRTRDAVFSAFLFSFLVGGWPYLAMAGHSSTGYLIDRFYVPFDKTTSEQWEDSYKKLSEWRFVDPATYFWEWQSGTALTPTDDRRLLANHLIATVVFLSLSMLILRRRYRKQLETGGRRRKFGFRFRIGPRFKLGRKPAMIWKELLHGRHSDLVSMGIPAALAIAPAAAEFVDVYLGRVSSNRSANDHFVRVYAVGMTLLSLWTWMVVSGRAASSISEERLKDTWVSLLSTRLTAREIIWGKILGAMRPLFYFWIAGICYLALGGLLDVTKSVSGLLALAPPTVITFTSAAFGLSQALRRKTANSAMGVSAFSIFLVNGLLQLFVSVVALLALLAAGGSVLGGGKTIFIALAQSMPLLLTAWAICESSGVSLFGDSEKAVAIYCGIVSTIGYFFLGLWFCWTAAKEFPDTTGRVETGVKRIDAPNAAARTPSDASP